MLMATTGNIGLTKHVHEIEQLAALWIIRTCL